jgi:hypothetical protein
MQVLAIVTLGAPHYPPPDTSMEMTRGALTLTSELLPGCFHDEVYYMSVGGSPIVGEKQNRQWWKFWEPTTVEGFAYNSYMGVCGKGGVEGENGRRAFHFVTKQLLISTLRIAHHIQRRRRRPTMLRALGWEQTNIAWQGGGVSQRE